MKILPWLITVLTFLILGCRSQASPLQAHQLEPTAPSNPFIPSNPTQTGPTYIPGDPLCLPERSQISLPYVSFEALPEVILDYLNRGGSLTALDETLYEQDMANQPVAVAGSDFTGNGKIDVIISIYDPRILTVPPQGMLLIYTCQEGTYHLSYIDKPAEYAGAPIIRYLQDLNANDKVELVTSSSYCGAHTCFEDIKVLAWTGKEFENLLPKMTDDLPFPYLDLVDEQNDLIFDIHITGSGFGSAGAGPQRHLTRQFIYNPRVERWQFLREEYGISNYRIHILHDADRAAENRDYDEALRLYQQVISDTTLDDWMNPEEERSRLSAYARYKMMMLYYLIGQPNFAQIMFNEMQSLYPSGHPLNPIAKLAGVFHIHSQQDDLVEACRSARLYAADNSADILDILGPSAFGYANPEFEPEDVCPEQ
jgi:hypothetical protein